MDLELSNQEKLLLPRKKKVWNLLRNMIRSPVKISTLLKEHWMQFKHLVHCLPFVFPFIDTSIVFEARISGLKIDGRLVCSQVCFRVMLDFWKLGA